VFETRLRALNLSGTQKGNNMAVNPTADQMVGILRETIVALVRRDGPDL